MFVVHCMTCGTKSAQNYTSKGMAKRNVIYKECTSKNHKVAIEKM